MPLASIHTLSVAFGGKPIVHELSLDIPAGGITVLLGRSGAGKTTLLRALNRLNECFPGCETTGEASLHLKGTRCPIYYPQTYGKNGTLASVQELRQRVGMVFQTPNVLPMSIGQNMALPLHVTGITDNNEVQKRMQEALEATGLWEAVRTNLHAPASTLSGGQQQRLCLARALALEPEILLLDEPTASLDPATTETIEQLILTLSSRYGIILVSHTLAQARRLARRVIVLETGGKATTLSAAQARQPGRLEQFFISN